MGYKIYDNRTNKEIPEDNQISSMYWSFEFDTGEEALYEIILRRTTVVLQHRTIDKVVKILKPLSVRELEIPTVFYWRRYLFQLLGNVCVYIGELRPRKEMEIDPIKIDWEKYDFETRKTVFESIYESFGFSIQQEERCSDINNLSAVLEQIKQDKKIKPRKPYHVPPKPTPRYRIPDKRYVVYVLYCEDTPNIYYIGQTGDIENRFKSHVKNAINSCSKPKHQWVEYINENGFELKYKILEEADNQNLIRIFEDRWIEKYIGDDKNVVLNFSTKHYGTDNLEFISRFNEALGLDVQGKSNDVNIISVSSAAVPNQEYITHAFKTTSVDSIVKRHRSPNHWYGEKREWAEKIRECNADIDVRVLKQCTKLRCDIEVMRAIEERHNSGIIILNQPTDVRTRAIRV